jgi:hypothetical protein
MKFRFLEAMLPRVFDVVIPSGVLEVIAVLSNDIRNTVWDIISKTRCCLLDLKLKGSQSLALAKEF